ncbi:Phage antirepressor protein [Lactococcus lactis subsp. lactis]|uniref:ORF6C domain-containing protein n=1 Tax=Lactococcus lactis TaxID=1358 RepID=UPI00071C216E|nr:ORF6C domain-containing protein [Lactococcus lactis]KST91677.1 Phage antirepressor protein [Lactococcus lactis subsp. lactis]
MNELQITELNGQRVLTTQQIAEGYGARTRTIVDNFNNNRNRFEEGKHFILLEGEYLRVFKRENENFGFAQNINKLYLWTEKGALLHAKSLGTDEAWDMYDILVDTYFKVQEAQVPPMTLDQQIAVIATGYGSVKQELVEVQDKVTELTERFGLPATNAAILNNTRNIHIIRFLGGKDSKAYHELGRKVFSEFGRDFKDNFGVPRYDAIPLSQYDEAIAYTKSWQPSYNTMISIRNTNMQIELE